MDLSQVPQALPEPVQGCTLSTAGQLTRAAEFNQLFAEMVVRAERPAPAQLRLELRREPSAARQAAELAVAETDCCSFFTFTLTAAADRLLLDIAVPDAHLPALAALASRAAGQVPA
jgi:hypothetical protein